MNDNMNFQQQNQNFQQQNQNFQQPNQNFQQPNQNFQQQMPGSNLPPKKKNSVVKILAIIFGVVVVIAALVIVIVSIVSANSNKLVCTSKEGNITLMYNDKELVGYTAKGIIYEFDQQNEYAKQIGVKAYLDEFSTWFSTNTTGTCEIKEK